MESAGTDSTARYMALGNGNWTEGDWMSSGCVTGNQTRQADSLLVCSGENPEQSKMCVETGWHRGRRKERHG